MDNEKAPPNAVQRLDPWFPWCASTHLLLAPTDTTIFTSNGSVNKSDIIVTNKGTGLMIPRSGKKVAQHPPDTVVHTIAESRNRSPPCPDGPPSKSVFAERISAFVRDSFASLVLKVERYICWLPITPFSSLPHFLSRSPIVPLLFRRPFPLIITMPMLKRKSSLEVSLCLIWAFPTLVSNS